MSGTKRATAMHFSNTAEQRARREALLTVPTAAPVPPASSDVLLTFADAVAAMRSCMSYQSDPGAASSAGVAGQGAPPPDAGTSAPPPPDAGLGAPPPPDADMGMQPDPGMADPYG